MPKTFTHFPSSAVCPLCGTSDDKECILVAIDSTQQGNISEAQPVHVACIKSAILRYSPKTGIIYMWCVTEEL